MEQSSDVGNSEVPQKQQNDPGASQHGNFINYYSFQSAEERIKNLPADLDFWSRSLVTSDDKKMFILDIGCNAGNFTQLLYENLIKGTQKDVYILGIDLDSTLVERCIENNKYPKNVTYCCADIMDSSSDEPIDKFLNANTIKRFNAVFCMSITMWIHLNHGDKGLEYFLKRSSDLSKFLVVEPQPWKCYRNAVKRMKRVDKSFDHFATLKMRANVEEDIISFLEAKCGRRVICKSVNSSWNRKCTIYDIESETS